MRSAESESGGPSESITDVTDAIHDLKEELRVLRMVLDELREDFAWALQNGRLADHPPPPAVIKRMPLDPTLPRQEWAAGIVREGGEREKKDHPERHAGEAGSACTMLPEVLDFH